ncbi:hypothetical protein BaRGS_00008144 [Batillaria attramentaria]|uniref:FAM69 N-terminal domain-containing protein n=1 Tax=Batillaria attramentaria TaxID=370345 RepID=A0ABD0LLV5_9CAEN
MVPPVLRFRAQFRRLDTIKQVCLVLLVAVLVLAVSIPYIIRITPNIYRPLPKLNAALVNRVDTVVSRPRFPCEDKHAIRETAELCQRYRLGVVTGDLCSPLCDRQQIQFTRCTSITHRQKQIMLVNCTDFCKTDSTVQAVLKTMVKKPALVLKSLPTWPTESYNSTDFHTAARNLLHEHVKIFTDVQFFNESDALKVMWGQGTEQDLQHVEYASAVLRSLSLLMLQPEYILSQALKDRGIFPTIYGTCGEFYLQVWLDGCIVVRV